MAKPSVKVPNVVNADLSGLVTDPGTLVYNTQTDALQYINNSATVVPVATGTGYVPYTGATTDLDMGAHSITATGLTSSAQILSTKTGSLTNINNSAFLAKGTTAALSLWDTSSGSNGALIAQDGDYTKFISAPYASGAGWVWAQYTASIAQVDILASSYGVVGGLVNIYGGTGGNAGMGGSIQIIAGSSGTGGSVAGSVYLRGGIASAGVNGNVIVDQGYLIVDTVSASSLVRTGSNSELLAATLGTHLSLPGGALTTDATNANTASTIVARDGSGNFSAGTITATLSGTATNATNIGITNDTSTNATMYPVWVTANTGNLPAKVSSTRMTFNPSTGGLTLLGTISTSGTAGVLTVNGAGSTTNAGSVSNFSSGNSATAANIYGIGVEKFSTDILYMGINKNSTTGAVPSNTCFISTYQSSGKLSIGRGASNGLPSTSDILLNGDGTITLNTGGSTLTGTQYALYFTQYGEGNYINFGTSGRNIGLRTTGQYFLSFGLDWNATSHSYVYANASDPSSAIELYDDGIRLKYAPGGTIGSTVVPSTGLYMDTSGNINIPGLTASKAVVTDGSKNLTSLTYTSTYNTASSIVSRDANSAFGAAGFAVGASAPNSRTLLNITSTLTGTDGTTNGVLFVDTINAPSSSTTNAASIYIYPQPQPPVSVTITNSCALYIDSGSTGGAGTITNGYSLYVNNAGAGTNKYAAYFGGNVGIGVTAPPSRLTINESGVSTQGTVATLVVNGAGSTSNAGATANFTSGSSNTAGNIYGIGIEKTGSEVLYLGINKNTTTGSVPANTAFISTFQSTGKLSIGRGGANSLPSTSDILLNGDGTVTFGGTINTLAITPIADNTYNIGTTTNRVAILTGATVRNYANADSTRYGNGSNVTLTFPNGNLGIVFQRIQDAGATFTTQRYDQMIGSPSSGNTLSPDFFIYNTTAVKDVFRLTSLQSCVLNNAAVATNATDGFLYIASCAGTPTGTPTAFTGRVAMVYDTTNNKFYIYNGAWKGVTLT